MDGLNEFSSFNIIFIYRGAHVANSAYSLYSYLGPILTLKNNPNLT